MKVDGFVWLLQKERKKNKLPRLMISYHTQFMILKSLNPFFCVNNLRQSFVHNIGKDDKNHRRLRSWVQTGLGFVDLVGLPHFSPWLQTAGHFCWQTHQTAREDQDPSITPLQTQISVLSNRINSLIGLVLAQNQSLIPSTKFLQGVRMGLREDRPRPLDFYETLESNRIDRILRFWASLSDWSQRKPPSWPTVSIQTLTIIRPPLSCETKKKKKKENAWWLAIYQEY